MSHATEQGLGLGLDLTATRFKGQWWQLDAVLDADFAAGRFRWNGQEFSSETAFLEAIGGSKVGDVRTIGPYVSPDATELLLNTSFDTALSPGWTAALDGASTAEVVAGAARLISDGAAGTGGKAGGAGIYASPSTVLDKAYRLLFTNSGPNSLSLRAGNSLYASNSYSAGVRAPSATPYVEPFSADGATTYLYLFRSAAGECNVDNVSLKECLPFKGFDLSGVTVEVDAIAPAAGGSSKSLLSFTTYNVNDEAWIRLDTAGHLRVQCNYAAGTICLLDLGLVTEGQPLKIRAGWKKDAFYAQLNDGPIVSDIAGGFPGVGLMLIGKDSQGNAWGAPIGRVKVWTGGGIEKFVGVIADAIHAEGDSFMGGAYGVVLPTTLNTVMGRTVYNTGAGGNTMDQISARIIASPAEVRTKTLVIWDGDQNGLTSVGAYCDLLAAAIAALGHSRFVVIPPCVNFGQTDLSQEAAIRDEMLARWPANVLDWRGVLTLDSNGVPVVGMYHDSGSDATHLSQAAMDLMAPAIAAKIAAIWG